MVAQPALGRNHLARVLLHQLHQQAKEATMKVMIAIVASMLASAALGQGRIGSTGPFTGYEADVLSRLWPEIRQAEDFEDINWRAHGVERAPGTREAQRFLATHWDEARQADRFASVDWDDLADGGFGNGRRNQGANDRFGRQYPANDGDFDEVGPFTRQEAAVLSRLWPEIREAGSYEDIDWRAHGVREPGDRDAQRIMARNWGEFREAGRFEDIDWETTFARSRTRVYR
jgi:hypothetical protein